MPRRRAPRRKRSSRNSQLALGRDMLWSPLSRLDVESYGRHVPRHALGDHGRGRLPKLFEMCRGAMCVQGGCVVVDLVEEHMVRVAVLEQDVELPAAWLLYARRCVLQNRGFEFLVFGRHDV